MIWVLWTARLCGIAYAAALLGPVLPDRFRPAPRTTLVLWTTGGMLLALHMGTAFHFLHGWSHSQAWAHTAQRTYDAIGIRSGVGIYANYLALAVWLIDIARAWRFRTRGSADRFGDLSYGETGSETCRTAGTPACRVATHVYLAFMQFQANVAFGQGAVRWFGLAVAILWCWLAWRQFRGP